MALLYTDATITPTKAELIRAWVPGRSWADGVDTGELHIVDNFRFDDPGGEVGLETLLVQAGDGTVLQVPVTYRAAPMIGAEAALITTMQHSVLGERWVYDAVFDPVYAGALIHVMQTGGEQADLERDIDGRAEALPRRAWARGTGNQPRVSFPLEGTVTVHEAGAVSELTVPGVRVDLLRRPRPATEQTAAIRLLGGWKGHDEPALLAFLRE